MKTLRAFFLPLLALPLSLGALLVFFPASDASAFSGAMQNLPFCRDDPTSGETMPTNFPFLTGEDATEAYAGLPQFDPTTSTFLIGFDSDFWDPSYASAGYKKLMLWYTDRDANTDSFLRLDYNTSTTQSSVGVVNMAPSPKDGVYLAILHSGIEGEYFSQLGSASGTAWGQRAAFSCYEYQASMGDIDYTENYGAEYPPIDEGGEADKEIRQPQFTYQQNDKAIKATPYSPEPALPDFTPELDEGYTLQGYYLGWNVWKCSTDFDSLTGTCNGTMTLIDDSFTPVDGNYEFTVTEYGNYQLEAEYWAQSCYRYPSYPATPDYCFYSQLRAHFDSSDFDYVNTYKNLIIDGRSITGDTKGEVCNVGGYCTPATAICHTIDSFIERLNCEMSGQLSVGLLNPSLQAVKTLVASVVVPTTPSCTIPLPNPVISGKTLNLSTMGSNLCTGSQTMRTTFPVIPVLVNAVFAMAILSFIIFRVNRLMDNNKHDVLEKV